MKVVITGHTKGIGKSIYEYFKKDLNNIVIGFSKSTLCDISKETDRQIILNELIDTDIFVNNAYHIHDDSQNILLEESFKLWKTKKKIIINVSSTASNWPVNQYAIYKHKQDKFCQKNIYEYPKIINLRPGYVDTDMVRNKDKVKMVCEDVVTVLDYVLKSNVNIHEITFTPK